MLSSSLILLTWAKIVQGEGIARQKTKFFALAVLSRSLSTLKIVQGEGIARLKIMLFARAMSCHAESTAPR